MKISSKLNELKPTDLNCNVFDVYSYDGLSMQDLLCQFFTKINECIKLSNETIDLASWLVNEGLKKEVVEKLMIWLNDGTLENLINVNLFDTLHTKIENINSQLAQKLDLNSLYYLNVRDFGVKGDGVNDDTEKIQELFEYIRNNNINSNVFFPSGEYIIKDKILINKSNIVIEGQQEKTVIKSTCVHETFLFDSNEEYENITFKNLTFKGKSDLKGQIFIKFQGASNVNIYNCEFNNTGGYGVVNSGGNILENFKCYNNKFIKTNDAGLLLRPLKNAYIHDNYFEGINGYSSSAPAHPIYLRADGNNINCLENIYIYNNIIRKCNMSDYIGKHAIKVVVNSIYSGMDYRALNVNVYGNNISEWTVGIHLAGVKNGLVTNNDLRLESTLNSNGITIERCEEIKIKNNYIETNYGTVYNCNTSIVSSSDVVFENNTINHKGYNCFRILDNQNLNNLRNYSICNNIINGYSNASDRYCIVLEGSISNIDIMNNAITHDVRCIHCGTSTIDNFNILNNTFKHKTNEIGTTGVGVNKSSATLSNFIQAGNTFVNLKNPNATENDIVISSQ